MYIGTVSGIMATNHNAGPETLLDQRMNLAINVCLESFVHQMFVGLERVMVDSYHSHALVPENPTDESD
jgi:hypothetical protein